MINTYCLENHPNDSRILINEDDICQCLSSRMGTGGNNTPMVLYEYRTDCAGEQSESCDYYANGHMPGTGSQHGDGWWICADDN